MGESNPSKRRTPSTHRSDRLERLAENGIFMKTSALMQKSSKDLCRELLEGSHTRVGYSSFPPDKFSEVLERVQSLNESRIQRDITPWVVPSAENLFFCGKLAIDYIADEVNAEWIRCDTMGGRRPKPDYAAGLMRKAFTKDEMTRLLYYSTPTKPLLFTPDLCFPFLMCEVKTGERGINEADRQNIHSASIAVRAIIELYKTAFGQTSPDRVTELYGKVLVFTVSHDHDRVCLYGHFAVLPDNSTEQLEFYRYPIALISLSMNDGIDRDKASNFVRNLYDQFVPEHLQRIKHAASLLPKPDVQQTGISFSASELLLEEVDSQQESQDISQQSDEASFQKPGPPASAARIDRLLAQLEQQRKDQKDKEGRMEHQMEQQKQDHKDKEKWMERQLEQMSQQMEKQMERQRQEAREQKEKISQQMEQQRQQMERQMEQQEQHMEQLVSILKQSKAQS